jgi:hypothetical protein
MKANEAPEKIYITNYDIEALSKDEQLSERWHEVKTQDTDIEYIRKDAITEKLLQMLNTSSDNQHFFEQLDDYIDELENKE